MNRASELSIRKGAVEKLRTVVRDLESVGDHGTVAKLKPILQRLSERRKQDTARYQDKRD